MHSSVGTLTYHRGSVLNADSPTSAETSAVRSVRLIMIDRETLSALREQAKSNKKNESHSTYQRTLYWCNQWRLLVFKLIDAIEKEEKKQ